MKTTKANLFNFSAFDSDAEADVSPADDGCLSGDTLSMLEPSWVGFSELVGNGSSIFCMDMMSQWFGKSVLRSWIYIIASEASYKILLRNGSRTTPQQCACADHPPITAVII